MSAPLPPPPPPPPPPHGPATLSEALGVVGRRNFLVQHVVLSLGHSYRVMDAEKRHLFTVEGDPAQNLTGAAVENFFDSGYIGRAMARSVDMSYALVDTMGTRWATLHKQGSANHATFTLVDNVARPWLVIRLARSLIGGIEASAVYPDGRPMMTTAGNLIRHNFAIRGPGGQDLAKVHQQWVAIRDTYNVDLTADIDPLYPLVYSVAIDYEKIR